MLVLLCDRRKQYFLCVAGHIRGPGHAPAPHVKPSIPISGENPQTFELVKCSLRVCLRLQEFWGPKGAC